MRRRALLCVVGATAVAGCGGRLGDDPDGTETETQTTRATTTPEPDPRVELADHELVRANEGSDAELATVVGEVRNVADEAVAAEVTATFEDADGEPLDTATAGVDELAAGRTWSFELVYPGAGEDAREVADYALAVETGD